MAGPNHHTIPRFLQNGFAHEKFGKNAWVWVYYRDGQNAYDKTKNIGAEDRFYGDGQENADPAITEVENKIVPLVQELRSLDHSGPMDDPLVPEMVAHFCVRTHSVRKQVTQMVEEVPRLMRSLISDRKIVRSMIQREFAKRIAASGLSHDQSAFVMKTANAYLDDNMHLLQQGGTEVMRAVEQDIPSMMSSLHNKALQENPDAPGRADELRKLRWYIIILPRHLVLGDMVCFFETNGRRRYKPLHEGRRELVRAYMPVASDRILVGTIYNTCPSLAADQVNIVSARCSTEYFISSEELPADSVLVRAIGEWSDLVPKEEIQRIRSAVKLELC
ncbi:MAG: DUF4238 domain-containing protein [Bryobacteraceae bacterium]